MFLVVPLTPLVYHKQNDCDSSQRPIQRWGRHRHCITCDWVHNRSRSVTICWLLSNLWLSSPNKSYWQIFGYLFPLLNSSHTIYLECSAGDSKKCTISRTISPVYINKDGAKYWTVVTSFGPLVAGVKVQSVITVNCETVSLKQHWILISWWKVSNWGH